MKIILATGIYPPDIGGPSMYAASLAEELVAQGHAVIVITYESSYQRAHVFSRLWQVVDVPRTGWIIRWFRFARALKRHGHDADIVYAFSSVSAGVPVWLSRLRHPKKVLRLGGDFFWERYTDRGGMQSLQEWYASWHWSSFLGFLIKRHLLSCFDAIVFSTHFQEHICERHFRVLPTHRVIENALLPGSPVLHTQHKPFSILFMGRFVSFKNISSLILALAKIPDATLTLTGEGPASLGLIDLVSELSLNDRVTFVSPVHGERKDRMLQNHDVLVIPSITEISPNVALEARRVGLPVLLTAENGLSDDLRLGMKIARIRTSAEIADAILALRDNYEAIAMQASLPLRERSWRVVAQEHQDFFHSLL